MQGLFTSPRFGASNHLRFYLFSLLAFVLFGQLTGQSSLSTSELPTRINYESGTDYTDYIIPNVGGSISFTLNGGDGGRRRVPDLCSRKGGQGATVQATFFIGPGSGQLAPGGRLRFIPGERGESRGGNGVYGAGGGGGSGLLYTTASDPSTLSNLPSLDFADAGTSWVILAVAGGGGGAGLSGVCDGNAGRGGVTTEDGGGINGGVDGNGGNTNGNGGFCGGGGYSTRGGGGEINAGAGRVSGGVGGFSGGDGVFGGYGYGGGGGGDDLSGGGGGGGGFSGGGGGGGDLFNPNGGYGGGSFVNAAASSSTKQGGGRTNNPRNGYIEYVLEDSESPVAVCQPVNVELDADGMATVYPADADGGSYDPNGDDATLERVFVGLTSSPSGGFFLAEANELNFDCSEIGVIENDPLWLRVTDVQGLEGYCFVSLNIEDNSPPTALCQPSITLFPDETGTVSITPADLDNGSFDNCGIVSRSISQTTFTCSDIGTYSVTLTVGDAGDNYATCTTEVMVKAYELDCPGDFCVSIPPGQTEAYVDLSFPIGTFTCGYFVDSRLECADCGTSGFTTTDKSGNYGPGEYRLRYRVLSGPNAVTDLCVINFRVAPSEADYDFTCPPDFVVDLPTDSCEVYVQIPEPVGEIPCGFEISSRIGGAVSIPFSSEDKSGLYGPGEYTLSWRLSENNQISDVCITNFSVRSDEVLNASCRDITVELDAAGMASITEEQINNGSTGVCGIASLSLSLSGFSCADVGTKTVTLTVQDNNGGTDDCTATVTVQDKILPTVICPTTVVQLDENGSGLLAANALAGLSTDNCAIQSETSPEILFDCDDLGTQGVTLTVVDEHGNENTLDCEVSVEEEVPPTALCQDITVQLGEDGMVNISAGMVDDGSSSVCGIQSWVLDKSSFSCPDEGSNMVTLTVTNAAGQEGSCNATVTVENNVPPTAKCKFVATNFDEDGIATIAPRQVNNKSVDACGVLIPTEALSLDEDTFLATDGTQPRTVTLTVTDIRGNTDQCTATVYFNDNIAPVCRNISSFTVYLDETGSYELFPEELDNGSSDNTGIVNLTFADGDVPQESYLITCGQILPFAFLRVTDGNENEDICNATILTIRDTISPVARCQDVLLALDTDGAATLSSQQVDNVSTDNCEITDFSLSQTAFTCADIGENTVTLTATDASGNDNTCTATVTVEDNTKPTVVCPEVPPVVYLDEDGMASLSANALAGASTDNCGIQSETSPLTNFTCEDEGNQEVRLTVADVNENSDSRLCEVEVVDNIKPTVVCPETPPVVYLDENGMASLPANALAGGSTDNCGIFTETSPLTDFTCTDVGPQQVLLTANDVHENSDSKLCAVQVVDNERPMAICPTLDPVLLDENGMASLAANALAGVSTDNCGILSEISPAQNFTCADVGTQLVLLTVEDVNGNVDRTECRVEVVDNVAPIARCQDVTIQLNEDGLGITTAAAVDNGSTDACGIDALRLSRTFFTCTEVGENELTLTVIDQNEQEASCTATVTVEDKVKPDARCQDVTVQLAENGMGSTTASAVNYGSSDACGIQDLTLSQTDFTCANIGNTKVTLTVKDNNDNTNTCTATVKVEDNIKPKFTCPEAMMVYTTGEALCEVEIPEFADLVADESDNCSLGTNVLQQSVATGAYNSDGHGSTISVSLSLTDAAGNKDAEDCNVVLMVSDDDAPIFTCPEAMTVHTTGEAFCEVEIPDFAALVTDESDNCSLGTNVLQQSVATGAYNSDGHGSTISVSLSLTDAAGNKDAEDCNVVLMVLDDDAPIFTCPEAMTVHTTGEAFCEVEIPDFAALVTDESDNCSLGTNVLQQSVATGAYNSDGHGSTILVSLSLTDAAGNKDAEDCSVVLTVSDDDAPTFTCPEAMTVHTTGEEFCEVEIPDFAALVTDESDNCSLGTNVLEQSEAADIYLSDGHGSTITVNLSLMDATGNKDAEDCSVILTVSDDDAPLARCEPVIVSLDAETGMATLLASDIGNASIDNCGIKTFRINGQSSLTYDCNDIGPQMLTLLIEDVAGLVDDCEATVKVLASSACLQPTIINEGGLTIADPCTCSATLGYFDEEVLIESNNPGEVWRIQSVSGFINPNDFDNEFSVGDLFVDHGDGTYSLVGMHASGVGYSIVAVSDFYPDEELMVSNLCYLPALANADTRVCSNDALGVILENISPSALADRFEVSNIDLGDAVQLNGIEAGMSSNSADLLADMVFEYTGTGSTTVEITVIPYNAEDCAGLPLVISVRVDNCEKPVLGLPIMNLGMLLIYLTVVVSVGLFAGFRIGGTAPS